MCCYKMLLSLLRWSQPSTKTKKPPLCVSILRLSFCLNYLSDYISSLSSEINGTTDTNESPSTHPTKINHPTHSLPGPRNHHDHPHNRHHPHLYHSCTIRLLTNAHNIFFMGWCRRRRRIYTKGIYATNSSDCVARAPSRHAAARSIGPTSIWPSSRVSLRPKAVRDVELSWARS